MGVDVTVGMDNVCTEGEPTIKTLEREAAVLVARHIVNKLNAKIDSIVGDCSSVDEACLRIPTEAAEIVEGLNHFYNYDPPLVLTAKPIDDLTVRTGLCNGKFDYYSDVCLH